MDHLKTKSDINCEIQCFHGDEEDNVVQGFSPEDGDSMFLQNDIYRQVYVAPRPGRTSLTLIVAMDKMSLLV